MTLRLTVPADRLTPLSWVAEIVLGDMLGLAVAVRGGGEGSVELTLDGATLSMPSLFPAFAGGAIDLAAPLPALPLGQWRLEETGLGGAGLEEPLPVLFGRPEVEIEARRIRCEVDILGTVFFMLSRYEEMALPHRDAHDRFPGEASLAHKGGFLFRPVVDEYVEALWAIMALLWPGLERRRRAGRIAVSCDVDQPFDRVGTSVKSLARSLGGDLAKRRDPALAARRARNFLAHRRDDFRFDPYYTFDWYMDVCERNGRRAAFYFIPGHTGGAIDGTYDLMEPRVLALIAKMHRRGHEIGVHGSYETFRDGAQIASERGRMIDASAAAGVEAEVAGNRQHYLRWDAGQTPDHLEAAGFGYDTTGSFADLPGFRYGTSHPFPMWSWRARAPLALRQHPLVLMECSVIAETYLGMGYSEAALDLMETLKRRALRHGGDFTLLWHNSHFLTAKDREFFQELLR